MKRLRERILLALLLVVIVFAHGIYPEASDSDFVIRNNVLLEYKGSDTDVVIPSGAFSGCRYLNVITIPAKVKNVGKYVFSDARCTIKTANNSLYNRLAKEYRYDKAKIKVKLVK